MDTDKLITTLGANPRGAYAQFKIDLRDVAATLASADYPGEGLNYFQITRTDTEYAALGLQLLNAAGEPILDEAGDPQLRPRRAIPMRPVRPPGNAPAAQLAFYREDIELAIRVAVAITKLRDMLLVACGPVIRAQLSTGVGGIAQQTLPMIMQHLETKYGTMTGDDLKELRAKLRTPFTTPANFIKEISKFKLNLTALTTAGDNMSQPQLIEILEEATITVVGFPTIIARYKRRVPILLNQRLDDLSDAIETEMVTNTTKDAKYANSASIIDEEGTENVAYATSQLSINETLKLINARLDTMESTIRATPGGGGRGRGSGGAGRGRGDGRGPGRGGAAGRGRGPGTPATPRTEHYCFKHGTQHSHAGTDCYVMKRDPSYTQPMKDATAPCTIDGYEGEK
jgi:hypothetical protein